jgi:hypothetical protein
MLFLAADLFLFSAVLLTLAREGGWLIGSLVAIDEEEMRLTGLRCFYFASMKAFILSSWALNSSICFFSSAVLLSISF